MGHHCSDITILLLSDLSVFGGEAPGSCGSRLWQERSGKSGSWGKSQHHLALSPRKQPDDLFNGFGLLYRPKVCCSCHDPDLAIGKHPAQACGGKTLIWKPERCVCSGCCSGTAAYHPWSLRRGTPAGPSPCPLPSPRPAARGTAGSGPTLERRDSGRPLVERRDGRPAARLLRHKA